MRVRVLGLHVDDGAVGGDSAVAVDDFDGDAGVVRRADAELLEDAELAVDLVVGAAGDDEVRVVSVSTCIAPPMFVTPKREARTLLLLVRHSVRYITDALAGSGDDMPYNSPIRYL